VADYRAMNRNSKVVDARKKLAATFSTTAPKPVFKAVPVAMSYNRFGSNRIPDRELDTSTKVFGEVVKTLFPNPSMIKKAVQDPSGTIRGAAEIASLTNPSSYIARASNLIQGKDLSLYGADMSDVEQAAELASLYPGGKTISAPFKVAARVAPKVGRVAGDVALSPVGMLLGTGSVGSGNYARFARQAMDAEGNAAVRNDEILSVGQERALQKVLSDIEEPSISTKEYNIQEAKDLVDSPQIVSGSPKAKMRGSVPVKIENLDEANELLFGSNVRNTGSVGSTLSNDIYEGSQIMVGPKLTPERFADDMRNVARVGVRQRLGGRVFTGNKNLPWAKTSLTNFESDFGEGAARALSVEGRKSLLGSYKEASKIPETIQYDHTVVSPTDLSLYRDETNELFKAKKITVAEKTARKQVENDMVEILKDPRNLIAIHRNTNVLLSSFDRERLLFDPDFASSVNIGEDTLGDIWGIMSREGSGYRKSVEEVYGWARAGRNGKRTQSVNAWQQWQNSRVENTLSRRNQRLVQSGIVLR